MSDEGITNLSDEGIKTVKITGLFVYPIKSCRGIALDTAAFKSIFSDSSIRGHTQ